MKYKIEISELREGEEKYPRTEKIYEQIVENIDIAALIAIANNIACK